MSVTLAPTHRSETVAAPAARLLRERAYSFELELESTPEQLWPLVADTNRFNRDAGVPAVERRGAGANARRRLRLQKLGVSVEWEEEPFEWVSPHRFSVARRFSRGPIASTQVTATLTARPGGGTRLVYEVRARPRNLLGVLAIAVEIGLRSRRRFAAVLRSYDASARAGSAPPLAPPRLAPGARARIEAGRTALLAAGAPAEQVERLCAVVERADDLTVGRLRPYVLADTWRAGRRETLELCLLATRHGLLELRWELLCPLCRGPAATEQSLGDVARQLHCDTCLIDFTADFDRSVEVTFRPVRAIRDSAEVEFCVGGPRVTPHVVAQQLVAPGGRRSFDARLEPGRYRLRALALAGALPVVVGPGGAERADIRAEPGWAQGEVRLAERVTLELENATADEQLLVLERTAWSDQAATAAEVTALQLFRDLFAAEALRPGQPISVGSLTVVFTDLRGSTRFYRDVGDAPAFGSVLEHIDLLREAVTAEDGAIVKSMGDAIMAVFPRPASAVRAMLTAQRAVAGRPLALKVGIHTGPCIAVDQNGVLDYFGTAVNLAARLVALSNGEDVVVSDAVLADPEVVALELAAEPVQVVPKGFEDECPALWRVAS